MSFDILIFQMSTLCSKADWSKVDAKKRGEVCNILLPNFKIVERSSASDSDRASAYYQLHSQIKDLGEEVGEGGWGGAAPYPRGAPSHNRRLSPKI